MVAKKMKKLFFLVPLMIFGFISLANASILTGNCTTTYPSIVYNGDIFDFSCTDIINIDACNGDPCTYFQFAVGGEVGNYCPNPPTIADTSYVFSDNLDSYTDTSAQSALFASVFPELDEFGCLLNVQANLGYAQPAFDILSSPTSAGYFMNMDYSFPEEVVLIGSGLLNNLGAYIALLIGLPLAFWFIKKTIEVGTGSKKWK